MTSWPWKNDQIPHHTSKIFQIANSAALAPNREIESLQHAIAWLGLNNVAGRAFSLSVQSGVFNVAGYEHEVKGLWIHGLATGFYGKIIAAKIRQQPDTGFLCGLLHAIGKPFVVHTVNQFRQSSDSPLPWTVMMTLMKESYIEVGRHLGIAWNFPDPVKAAINLHEDHAYHLATSPTKGAVITCLAKHLATHFLDPEASQADAIRALPVVQDLGLLEEDMNILLESQDTIRAQLETMLL